MLESHLTERRTNLAHARRPAARQWITLLLASLVLAPSATAHPLGNDNVEHVSVLWILPDRLEVDLMLFIAETQSTRLQKEEIDTDEDNTVSPEEQRAWLDRKAREFQAGLRANLDGQPLPLTAVEDAIDARTGKKTASNRLMIEMPGFAGMPTYRLLIRYVGRFGHSLTGGPHILTYEDRTYAANPGLKRILLDHVAGVEVLPPHPGFWDTDPFRFEQYDPANLPQERSATVRFNVTPAGGTAASAEKPAASATLPAQESAGAGSLAGVPDRYKKGLTGPGSKTRYQAQADRLMELLQGRWGLMVLLMVAALSFTWGAAHALMPGHAKTVVAAYLISQSGTYWHAVLLAIVVTVTHTALVVLLGGIWAYYQATNPSVGPQVQLWLGLVSGLLVAGMGLVLVWRAFTGRLLSHHHHDHDHDHAEPRSWLRRLFTHSHPHPPMHNQIEKSRVASARAGFSLRQSISALRQRASRPSTIAPAQNIVDPDHPHTHEHEHAEDHAHTHDHPHVHEHDHPHEHAHAHEHASSHQPSHDHTHAPDHPRSHHHEHSHDHGHDHAHAPAGHVPTSPADRNQVTGRMILILGITGGIVPCPTATIIMLLGIGANVVLGALFAIAVFSLGLALTLMLIGFLALSSRRFAARLLSGEQSEGQLSGPAQLILLRLVPAASGLAVITLGLAISANYLYYMRTGTALFGWMG
jgi:nickel/cobalt transporter (NicO) family protein